MEKYLLLILILKVVVIIIPKAMISDFWEGDGFGELIKKTFIKEMVKYTP